MNIAIYTESYKPYLSGVTVSVDTFAQSLVQLGHRVYIFAPEYPGYQDKNSNPYIFRFRSIGSGIYKGFHVAWPFSFRYKHYIETAKLDIIHSNSPYHLGWKAYFTARKLKIPFVYTFHTLFTEYLHFIPLVPEWLSAPIVISLIRMFCNKLCDHVVVPTAKTKQILQEKYKVTAPIEVIPTGVLAADVDKASPAGIRERYGIQPDTVVLLYVGRFSKEKNIYFLLQMFQQLLKKEPTRDIRLMLIARGPLEHEVKEYVRRNALLDKVIFTGEVTREHIYAHYKAADLFVCASKTETQGLVLSEAKACGLPGVAIDAAGVSEMITQGVDGYLVPENEEIFAQHVLELVYNSEQRRKFAAAARKIAEEKFLDEAVAKKLLMVYEKARRGKSEVH
jgi:1,2-diacylglycerol 3-alpha-glucosyltransferase